MYINKYGARVSYYTARGETRDDIFLIFFVYASRSRVTREHDDFDKRSIYIYIYTYVRALAPKIRKTISKSRRALRIGGGSIIIRTIRRRGQSVVVDVGCVLTKIFLARCRFLAGTRRAYQTSLTFRYDGYETATTSEHLCWQPLRDRYTGRRYKHPRPGTCVRRALKRRTYKYIYIYIYVNGIACELDAAIMPPRCPVILWHGWKPDSTTPACKFAITTCQNDRFQGTAVCVRAPFHSFVTGSFPPPAVNIRRVGGVET